ncbi:MAG: Processive diacylglycerol beta-glucosyltransferase [Chlamydiae bacterium]|nr:Processive diacylglycerol beta-glucosyltransferase [Chlamydiota bacterium]
MITHQNNNITIKKARLVSNKKLIMSFTTASSTSITPELRTNPVKSSEDLSDPVVFPIHVKIKNVFQKCLRWIEDHPKTTILTISATLLAGATLLALCNIVAIVSAVALFVISGALLGLKIAASLKVKKTQEIVENLRDLKVRGILKPDETDELVQALDDPQKNYEVSRKILDRLSNENCIKTVLGNDILQSLTRGNNSIFFDILDSLRCKQILKATLNQNNLDYLNDSQVRSVFHKRDWILWSQECRNSEVIDNKIRAKIHDFEGKFHCFISLSRFSSLTEEEKSLRDEVLNSIEKNDPSEFQKKTIQFYKLLTENVRDQGDKISALKYEETIAQVQCTKTENAFTLFGKNQKMQRLCEDYDKKISKYCAKLEKSVESPKSLNIIDPKNLMAEIQSHFDHCSILLENYLTSIGKVDLHFALYFGNFNQKFKVLNDIADHILAKKSERGRTHSHLYCSGCHFSYTTNMKEGNSLPCGTSGEHFNNQRVDVVRSRVVLEQKIKQLTKQIRSDTEALKNLSKVDEKDQETSTETLEEEIQKREDRLKHMEDDLSVMKKIDNHNAISPIGPLDEEGNPIKKKSYLFFTCSYGYGHNMAAAAMAKGIGKKGGHVSVVDLTKEVLDQFDYLKRLTNQFGLNISSSDLANHLLQNRKYYWINLATKFALAKNRGILSNILKPLSLPYGCEATHASPKQRTEIKDALRLRLLMERPDCVVTSFNRDLNPIIEIAEELGIPIVHMATDMDMTSWDPFSKSPGYPYLKCTVPSDDPKVWETSKPLQKEQCFVSGIPVQPEYQIKRTPEEVDALKERMGIDPEARVIIVSGGGNGQNLPFPEILAYDDDKQLPKIHVIVIAGKNTAFGNEIEKLGERVNSLPDQKVKVQVAKDPSTETAEHPYFIGPLVMNDLREISDLDLGKAGGISTAESIVKDNPMLFDGRKNPFLWEKANMDFVESAGRGKIIKNMEEFKSLLLEALALRKEDKKKIFPDRPATEIICEEMTELMERADKDEDIQRKRQFSNQYE